MAEEFDEVEAGESIEVSEILDEEGQVIGTLVDDVVVVTSADGTIVDETIDVLDADGNLVVEEEIVDVYDADAHLVVETDDLLIVTED